ncbi:MULTISPECIES: proline/glycine betaine ABC transporter permease [Methanocalculus]|uniref:ABC transporter permease n=1 Tax=Methanocalculus TaxID=71151 RepID=UPI00209DBFB9|nr:MULTISPECIES: proline/glycine betaine ABC transporter permease [unclassified Methanocalculus]MCP1662075.1 glycine betaine/proline transport system permease protein [Methanocalculus sp. AMF5]
MPKIPIGQVVSDVVDWIDANLGWLLDAITTVLRFLLNGFQDLLMVLPPLAMILVLGVIIFFITRKDLRLSLLSIAGLLLIWNLQLWSHAMLTLALVLSSTIIALIIGIPLGILAANSDTFNAGIRVLLDFMQTMPAFVYLVPAVIFFSLGNVPGMIATVVFAMPPAIRLTNLGIRQIPVELIEVSDAFGATPRQKLIKVQLPVALPTIMAGVNQCIMLALSMVVIASMIGAGGLGYQVLVGIQRVNIAMGFEAGLAIVIIAIILDRITQNLIKTEKGREE